MKLLNASLVGRDGRRASAARAASWPACAIRTSLTSSMPGVSPQGQPYLVLERVNGERIDACCDANSGWASRLASGLFLDVLAAVAHAHANLVVHRDLKPSNVLVERTAGEAARLRHRQAAGDDDGGDTVTALTRDGEALAHARVRRSGAAHGRRRHDRHRRLRARRAALRPARRTPSRAGGDADARGAGAGHRGHGRRNARPTR